jgi:hypothetical protein
MSSPFYGTIDDVLIYNRVLSEKEIDDLYKDGIVNGIGDFEVNSKIKIFPNPTAGSFRIVSNISGTFDVKISDLSSREVLVQNNVLSGADIQISDKISSGIYLVVISDNNNNVLHKEKLILQRK